MKEDADKKRDEAIEHIEDACKCLSAVVIGRANGVSLYRSEYRDTLRHVLSELIKLREMLD